ncbi:hypothetical protein [Myxococcus landrumensis]|uniref:Lipoprotein n=1 Tax=Myxococcus landrumensis TaxID=2813577 RepID=A0ABX7N8R2_9BACT|nr:hypothetical protein [Myxococcus landrumus]QSQ14032.1 hypothetical protein JY572_37920 [Myxococcus landrumus]
MCTLDGSQPAIAEYFRATTGTGPGFQCDATVTSCVDLGPGTRNHIGTDAAGRILLGPDDGGGATEVRLSGSLSLKTNLIVGAAIDLNFNAFMVNSWPDYPVVVSDADGLKVAPATTLKTCTSALEGTLQSLTFAAGSGNTTRLCYCTSDGAASPAYHWQNVATGFIGTGGGDCPL